MENVPGPGQYNPNNSASLNAYPRTVFGTSTREKDHELEARAKVPGPGNYKLKDIIGSDGPSKSLGHAFSESEFALRPKRGLPGPGQYNPNTELFRKSLPSIKFGTESRDFAKKYSKNTPAPGHYEPKEDLKFQSSSAWK
jgi:hypothetical protein